MKTIGIAIDSWKLATFQKILDEEGFHYEVKPGVTTGCLTLMVRIHDIQFNRLHSTVKRCQLKATEVKG